MGYSSQDKAGKKGIETVCRVCQTNGAGPCGKEIIIGSVSVKHVNTIQKREGGKGGRGASGGAAASEGPRAPGLSAATLALPKNVCNPQADWGDPVALPSNAAGFPFVSNAQRGQGGRRGVSLWCPFLSPALWELRAIVWKLQLHFSDLLCTPVDSGYWLSGWTWKGYDPHPYSPCLLPPMFFLIFGGPPRTREEAGLRFTCSIKFKKGLRRLMRKRRQRGAEALALTKPAKGTMSKRES